MKKTAVTVAEDLLLEVDRAAKARGESRSAFITHVLRIAVKTRRDAETTRRLDRLFADEEARREQLVTAGELDRIGSDWDDERW